MRILFILIAILACCDSALACSCSDRTTTEQYSQASHVFRARIESVGTVVFPKHVESFRLQKTAVLARFELLETYKGSPQSLDAIYTNPYVDACGRSIVDAEEYVFFADAKGIVGQCDGSTQIWSSESIRELIETLKRLASEQSDHETGPAAPENRGNE